MRAGPLALALGLTAAACGYQLAGPAARLPQGAARVFVPPLLDLTPDAEAGALVAAELRRELARRGAEGDPGAPARLEGEVSASRFGLSAVGGTYRATLRVTVRLVIDGRVERELTVEHGEDLLAGVDPLETEGRRRVAIRRAAEAVARPIIDGLEVPQP